MKKSNRIISSSRSDVVTQSLRSFVLERVDSLPILRLSEARRLLQAEDQMSGRFQVILRRRKPSFSFFPFFFYSRQDLYVYFVSPVIFSRVL